VPPLPLRCLCPPFTSPFLTSSVLLPDCAPPLLPAVRPLHRFPRRPPPPLRCHASTFSCGPFHCPRAFSVHAADSPLCLISPLLGAMSCLSHRFSFILLLRPVYYTISRFDHFSHGCPQPVASSHHLYAPCSTHLASCSLSLSVSLFLLSQCLRFPLFMSLRSERCVTFTYVCLGRTLSAVQSVCLYIKGLVFSCKCHLKTTIANVRSTRRCRERTGARLVRGV
jgi:hypothetical protein